MAWTERQRAMLRAMGLSVWAPPVAPAPPEDADAPDAAAPAETGAPARSASVPAPPPTQQPE